MTDTNISSTLLWDTLELSAEPLRGRSDILVVAQVKAQRADQKGYDVYRVNFELNRQHGIVSQDTEVSVIPMASDDLPWRYSGRRDIVVAIKDHFLKTQLYTHVARQLGWISS